MGLAEPLALVASSSIAGSMFLFTDVVKEAIPPLSLVALRLSLGCLGLLLAQLTVEAKALTREELLYLCLIGLWLGSAFMSSLQNVSG